MSEQLRRQPPVPASSMLIDDLARAENARPVTDVRELVADLWDSDEELEAFLTDLRTSRRASLS